MDEYPNVDGLTDANDASLDALSAAFAAALRGQDGARAANDELFGHGSVTAASQCAVGEDQSDAPREFALRLAELDPPQAEADAVSPLSILEAMLFVGRPDGQPLTATQAAAAMQGVSTAEIEELTLTLNERYAVAGCPYEIQSVAAGYRLVLRAEFNRLRERFFGRMKAARLSQSAIDVLSLVAYHQPIHQQEVDRLRDKHSATLLAQLVRRRLLRVDRDEADVKKKWYRTTERFLDLLGLESLEDLPQSYESDPAV